YAAVSATPDSATRRGAARATRTSDALWRRLTPTAVSTIAASNVSRRPYASRSATGAPARRAPAVSITVYVPMISAGHAAHPIDGRDVCGRTLDTRPTVTTAIAAHAHGGSESPRTTAPSSAALTAPPPRASG